MLIGAIFGKKRTDEELAAYRAQAIAEWNDGEEVEFTCDECGAKNTCDYVFDLYNTHGDCLAEK